MRLKLLKHINILFIIIISFLINCSGHPNHIECQEDLDCLPLKICINNECVDSTCEDPTICGEGVCLMKGENSYGISGFNYYCFCDKSTDGKIIYYDKNINYCYSEDNFECNLHEECNNISISDDDWIDGIETNYCTKDHKCVEYCESDRDCIGENEYCSVRGHCREFEECQDYQYFNNISSQCEPLCENDEDCMSGICSYNKRCLYSCETDQNCIDNSWSVGSICNLPTNTCIKENYSTPFEILKYFIDKIGFDCDIDGYDSYFELMCGDYVVDYEFQFEMEVDQIAIDNTRIELEERDLDNDQMEYYINEAKKRAIFTLAEIVPNRNFKYYDIFSGYIIDFWGSRVTDGVDSVGIMIQLPQMHNGLMIFGGGMIFYYDFNFNLFGFQMGVIDIAPTPDDQEFVDLMIQKSEEITEIIKENIDYQNRVYSSPVYFYENGEMVLGYVIGVDNMVYKYYDSEYDGTYQSIEPIFNID